MIDPNHDDDCDCEDCDEHNSPGSAFAPEWDSVPDEETYCHRCGSPYDGGHRCGVCGNGDPLDTGEFDPVTGEQW